MTEFATILSVAIPPMTMYLRQYSEPTAGVVERRSASTTYRVDAMRITKMTNSPQHPGHTDSCLILIIRDTSDPDTPIMAIPPAIKDNAALVLAITIFLFLVLGADRNCASSFRCMR